MTAYLPWSRKVTAHLTLRVFGDRDSQKSRMILGFLTLSFNCPFCKKSTVKIKLQRELLQVLIVTLENPSFHVSCLLTRGEGGEIRDPFPANPPMYYHYASLTLPSQYSF